MIPTTVSQVFRDGKLINSGLIDKIKHDTFLDSLQEGDMIECTYEKINSSGSYAQISKIKVCTRALANESGDTFESMQQIIKSKCGLMIGGEEKSYADCSKEELAEAIKTVLELGDLLGVNCHG